MYENVVFAILAMCFAFLSIRPHKKIMDIPVLGIIYRVLFIICVGLAVTQSYNILSTTTSFTYNAAGFVQSANAVNVYSSQGFNQDFDLYAVGTLAFFGAISMILEYVSDVREWALSNLQKVFKR